MINLKTIWYKFFYLSDSKESANKKNILQRIFIVIYQMFVIFVVLVIILIINFVGAPKEPPEKVAAKKQADAEATLLLKKEGHLAIADFFQKGNFDDCLPPFSRSVRNFSLALL